MTEAEKTSILEWMDKLIKLNNALAKLEDYNSEIQSCYNANENCVFMCQGLKRLAEATGAGIKRRDLTGSKYYHLFISYNGCEFYTMHNIHNKEV
ncbi:MAG: hypothetical protein ACRC3H_13085 [Lachnospiraceae bacterium]